MGRSSYSENAEFWIEIIRSDRDRYRTELTDSAVLSMVGTREGSRVLDAGCGEGYLSRALTRQGARVVGVDASAELVAAAKLETARLGVAVEHLVADVRRLPQGFAASFDVVVFNHVLNDLEDPAPALSEAARALRPGGRAVALMLHPCFARPVADVIDYFQNHRDSRHFEVDGTTSPKPVTYWIRPLESYTTLLAEAGLAITALREPQPTTRQLEDPWWREHFKFPKFLLLEAAKTS